MRPALSALCLSLLLSACALTPESRIEQQPDAFSQLPPDQQAKVKAGDVDIGYSEAAARLALGEPDRIIERTTAEGRTVTWQYLQTQPLASPGLDCGGYYSRFLFTPPCFVPSVAELSERLRLTFREGRIVSIDRLR